MFFSKKTTHKSQVILTLKDDNTLSIELGFDPQKHNVVDEMVLLLHRLFSQDLYEPIANMLVKLGASNPAHYDIAEQILIKWLNKEKKTKTLDEPFIHPLKAFRNYEQ